MGDIQFSLQTANGKHDPNRDGRQYQWRCACGCFKVLKSQLEFICVDCGATSERKTIEASLK